VAFGEALMPEFKDYAQAVVDNAKAMADALQARGYDLVTGGTDNHLMLVDLRSKKLNGKLAEAALSRSDITCNKNGVPFDTEKPTITSGIRLGSPAATSRGFGTAEFATVGNLIADVLDGLARNGEAGNAEVEAHARQGVHALTNRFPIYSSL
jgi:glycine hydroxymethyltransferase